jgi:peptidoglycan glycosyltransferase
MAALEAMGDYVGTLAVYNYETGEILCAVTTPTFDPDNVPDIAGDTTGAFEGIYLNRFLQSAYIPGSIFKVVTTAAALEEIEGILDMRFTCTGKVPFGVDKVSCERVHGKQTFKEAMAVSCNCVYAQVAMLLGPEKLQSYADQFGVAERIRFDGITTVAGNYQFIGQADVNVAWSAIGQHLDQVNPCAYLSFIGAIANGGVAAKPHIVSKVTCGTDVTYEASTQKGERIMSEQTAKALREMMRCAVVEKYGAENFPDLTVCAKSGTAQSDNKASNALFTGFVADEDLPLSFIVIVEEGGYGRQACVPVISSVLEVCREVLS